MYSIPNVHGVSTKGSFAKRVLQDTSSNTEANTIHITGNGVAGIFVGFMLIFPVISMIYFMDSIFVNTKLVEKSLLVGKIDN